MHEKSQEYFDVGSISQAFARVGEIFAKTMNSIIDVFRNVVPRVLNLELFKKISRKRFIKLLMADGIQRNDAQKIAIKYHKEQGYYCMFDVYKETKNKG